MKILVCISQTPDTTAKISFNAEGTEFNNTGVQFIMNPYDEWYALVRACELREALGGTVVALNVGPVANEITIRKALAIGADEAVRIDADPKSAGFVAKQIAEYAKPENFDLVFFGKETIDYNGSEVGAMVAEHLNLPYISYASKLDLNDNKATIERVIQEEIRKKVEEARRPKPVTPTPAPPVASKSAPATASNTARGTAAVEEDESASVPEDGVSIAFKQNRGQLPWPVDNGFISRGFGRQKHPTLRNIEITNNGVDIRTDESAVVRAIYEGKVAGVQFIPGHDYTVILQHGNYYTVYSNLSESSLSKGDRVKAKQILGRVSSNAITGASELHFEVWHEKTRLNPAGWINK